MGNYPPLPVELVAEIRSIVGPAKVDEGGESLEILCQDFFWYSAS